MELAMQFFSTDETVRSDTLQDLKDFNQQSLSTRAEKGEVNSYDASNQKSF